MNTDTFSTWKPRQGMFLTLPRFDELGAVMEGRQYTTASEDATRSLLHSEGQHSEKATWAGLTVLLPFSRSFFIFMKTPSKKSMTFEGNRVTFIFSSTGITKGNNTKRR